MSNVDVILSQAKKHEKEYDWLGAIESYKKALSSAPQIDILKMGQTQERIGYAFYRAATQAENVSEFRDRMCQAVANYEKAKEFYAKARELAKTPLVLRCDAMIAYLGYWLASEVSEKKRLLDECWRLTKEALKAFEDIGNGQEYGTTYVELSSVARLLYVLAWNFEVREKMIKEATECGEKAIVFLSSVGDSSELARAYVETAAYLNMLCPLDPNLDAIMMHHQKSLSHWEKAVELSEESAFLELLSPASLGIPHTTEQSIKDYEKGLDLAKKARDKALIGNALDWLAGCFHWLAPTIDEPIKRLEAYQRALQYAEDAKQQYAIISFMSPRGGLWVESPHADHFWELALYEIDLKKRRGLLEKAIKEGTQEIAQAESSGYPEIMSFAHHVLSKALVSLAQTETSLEEKQRLVEKALKHRKESIRITDQINPSNYRDKGVMLNYMADLKAELSKVEKDVENRRHMLVEAASDKERGLQICIERNLYSEKIGELSDFAMIGRFQYSYGELLIRLHSFTNNDEHQRKAIKAFEEAAESFQKLDMVSRIAECLWKAARGYDALGEYPMASESFKLASNSYRSAAEKIPQLKDFYQCHALYMEAWYEIEKARHYHGKQEYGSAKEHYEKAATLHKSLKQWSYLAPNYSAWASIENAEDLSRKERSEDAILAFEQAAKLFNETKKSLQTELSNIENEDEKQMAATIIKATDLRCEYCVGRIALEEAKILDRKGDHHFSSEKYASGAQTFEKIAQKLELQQDRKELTLLITLSKAWQKMTQAEAETSPTLYIEASQLFEAAKELSPNETAKTLALGHSRFCLALEAGTRFADTGDATFHTTAIQHLGSAARYYVKAGFQNAAEYAKATELLLDAYMHMDAAKKEKNPEEKTKLYTMAEKILQSSANSYMKAEHPEKREQVLRLLENVKEERELALSLSEVLHPPTIASSTSAFSTPTPTHENAVGLERFEYADIQANVITRQKELRVGENLDLEIELVNAGKGPALLIKLAEVIPEGFELTEKPETYRVEDSYINMKGKRLDPLKTEEVRLVLKPKVKGTFPLKPRILYLDENGKYKTHEPEPTTITVKELGIKGWVKGEI